MITTYFYREGRKDPSIKLTFLRYLSMDAIQSIKKKQQVLDLLEIIENKHDIPNLSNEKEAENMKKLIDKHLGFQT